MPTFYFWGISSGKIDEVYIDFIDVTRMKEAPEFNNFSNIVTRDEK